MSVPSQVNEFNRRSYTKKEHPTLVEMIIFIDGNQYVQVNSKKVMMMAFLSRPDDEGFGIEIVEKGRTAFTDMSRPGEEPERLRKWQQEALSPREETTRRNYYFDGSDLTSRSRIEVRIRVDGDDYMSMGAREPGFMGIIVRDGAFDIDVVGPSKGTYADRKGPGTDPHPLYPWQIEALQLKD